VKKVRFSNKLNSSISQCIPILFAVDQTGPRCRRNKCHLCDLKRCTARSSSSHHADRGLPQKSGRLVEQSSIGVRSDDSRQHASSFRRLGGAGSTSGARRQFSTTVLHPITSTGGLGNASRSPASRKRRDWGRITRTSSSQRGSRLAAPSKGHLRPKAPPNGGAQD
jgi:hypothetical protein